MMRGDRILKGHLNKPGGYLRVRLTAPDKKRHWLRIHRLVLQAFGEGNPHNKPCCDHIDGNPINNHISNLRWATIRENNQNSKVRSDNKLRTKGVTLVRGRFRVQIRHPECKRYVGTFDTLDQAIRERHLAELRYFKEFMRQ